MEIQKHKRKEIRNAQTDSKKLDELRSPEPDKQGERKIRKKRDHSDSDKHQGDVNDRQMTSRDEIVKDTVKDTRQKKHKQKDGKYRDKYREEMDRENKHWHDKKLDDNPPKDRTSIKSDDKYAREVKDSLESRRKRIKLSESEYAQVCKFERYNDRVHDCDYDEDQDSKKLYELRSPELDKQGERKIRKKRDHSDSDKHQGDVNDRQMTSRDEIVKDTVKDTRQKKHKQKDGKYRDNYREEMDRENKHWHDKQLDDNPPKDCTSIKSYDKHATEEKDSLESRRKRIKLSESEYGQVCKFERCNDRVHDCDYDEDQDRGCGHRHDLDDQRAPTEDSKTKKSNSDEYDGYSDNKSRDVKGQYPDGEKRSGRADSDFGRGRSLPQNRDLTGTCNKHRSTPATNTNIGKDRYRHANSPGLMYKDSLIEQRLEGSQEGYSGVSVRGHNYKSKENSIKIDDGPVRDLSTERPSTGKADPKGLMERSPSTTIECRYLDKNDVRRGLEIEESGMRNIIGARDFYSSNDRQVRGLTLKKPQLDEPPQAGSSFYGGTSQSNVSLVPPSPAFQAALDRPFMGSVEDNARNNSSTQYRRSIDPGFKREHDNSWRALPNWTSSVPNGFVSFQPGPVHGGFQTILPQFAAQPLFGITPSVEVNHASIPYHIADANRFPGHLHPIGWQNMMDGTAPAHLCQWESNNGVFRYGGSDWDWNRNLTNIHGWHSGRETWKEQNGDSKKNVPFPSFKHESVPSQVDDVLSYQAIQVSRNDKQKKDHFHEKPPETKSPSLVSREKVPLSSLSTTVPQKALDSSTPSDNTYLFSQYYLSKLDISPDLVTPELYNQCMGVVNADSSGPIDADSTAKLFHKNGSSSRVPKNHASTLSRHFPFPAIDNSIFQKAIELYRKQRAELPNGGKVDISAYQQVQVDDPPPIKSLENQQVTASASDGTADVPMPLLGQKKLDTLSSPAKENFEDIDQISCQTVQDHEKQRATTAGLCEKEDKDASKVKDLGDAEENTIMAFKTESQLSPTFHNNGDRVNKYGKVYVRRRIRKEVPDDTKLA